jgi:hypothetical protein
MPAAERFRTGSALVAPPREARRRAGAPRLRVPAGRHRGAGRMAPTRTCAPDTDPGCGDSRPSGRPQARAPSRPTRCKRLGGGHTSAAVALSPAEAHRDATRTADAEPALPLCASIVAVLARPRGRPGCPGRRRFVLLRPRERQGRGVLRPPGRGPGIARLGGEHDRVEATMELGGTQRSAAGVEPGRMACNPRASRLQPRHLPPLCQPLAHCVERRLPVPDGAHQGCDAPPTREHGRGVGREETVAHGGTLQAPEDAKNHGPRCHGMPLRYGHGQAAPPVVASAHSIIAEARCLH